MHGLVGAMFGVNRKLAIVANGNVSKMGSGNTSVTQSTKAFLVICAVLATYLILTIVHLTFQI